ncbi:MAG: metallophosphoesterase, partial [Balneolaceae bacterium]
MKRREWLKAMGLVTAGVPAGQFTLFHAAKPVVNSRRVLRIAHMTDPHLNPSNKSAYWTTLCIEHIQSLQDKPDVIFNGGDTINDALRKSETEVLAQWDVWDEVAKKFRLPVVHTIGNHDVWGIADAQQDPRYAKAWAVEKLGLPNRYYDYEQNGWHFIVLDSTHLKEDGTWYTAKLDTEQFEWLKQKLQDIPSNRPVFIFSHIPIVCAAAFFDGDNERTGEWTIPGAWVHIDARSIVELFHQHKNVRVAVSGHIHLADAVLYNEVTYYCN